MVCHCPTYMILVVYLRSRISGSALFYFFPQKPCVWGERRSMQRPHAPLYIHPKPGNSPQNSKEKKQVPSLPVKCRVVQDAFTHLPSSLLPWEPVVAQETCRRRRACRVGVVVGEEGITSSLVRMIGVILLVWVSRLRMIKSGLVLALITPIPIGSYRAAAGYY